MARSTLVTLPTGTGKTVVFATLSRQFLERYPTRVMMIAHREELNFQAAGKFKRCCSEFDVGVEMADLSVNECCADKPRVVVASVQTLNSRRGGEPRLRKFAPAEFGLLITDECVPAGTLVDGVPIEKIEPGMLVNSWNHEHGCMERRLVTRVHRNPVPAARWQSRIMVEMEFLNGDSLICTPGHPIFDPVNNEYRPAILWKPGTLVFVDEFRRVARTGVVGYANQTEALCRMRHNLPAEELDKQHDAHLFGSVQGHSTGGSSQNIDDGMCPLRCDSGGEGQEGSRFGEAWKGLLRSLLPGGIPATNKFENYGANKQDARLGPHEGEKSDASAGDPRASVESVEGDGPQAMSAGWEWARSHEGRVVTRDGRWNADERDHQDRPAAWQWLSATLQSGRGLPTTAIGDRDRRPFALLTQGSGCRSQEGGTLECDGVVRVTLHESAGDERFGGLCPDGHVYNLEVEGNHNYFANGVLVHNCHHAPAASYQAVYEHFMANPLCRHLGVTATPDRADEVALGKVFDSVAFEYGIVDAIRDGWLVPIEQQFVHIEGLDLSQCQDARFKDGRHDLRDNQVAEVMEREGPLHGVVDATRALSGVRRTLVFAASVAHGHLMADIFNRHTPGSANMIDGKTPTDERRMILDRYRAGEFQFLVNCAVFLEGFDCPEIACISMARPTKSRSLYAQVVGRGTRPLDGCVDPHEDAASRRLAILGSTKRDLVVLDFVGNAGKHKLVCTADILGSDESDEVVARAKRNALEKSQDGQSIDMRDELERARLELEEELKRKHEAELAAQAKQGRLVFKARFSTAKIDPFNVFDLLPRRESGWNQGRLASEKQVATLARMGVGSDVLKNLSFTKAHQMLDVLIRRRKEGLCTVKQANILRGYGYPGDLKFEQAKRVLDVLQRHRWQPLPWERMRQHAGIS